MTQNFDVYIPVVILLILGVVMVGGALFVGSLIRPKNPNKIKWRTNLNYLFFWK